MQTSGREQSDTHSHTRGTSLTQHGHSKEKAQPNLTNGNGTTGRLHAKNPKKPPQILDCYRTKINFKWIMNLKVLQENRIKTSVAYGQAGFTDTEYAHFIRPMDSE